MSFRPDPESFHIFREHELMRGSALRAGVGQWDSRQTAHGHDFLEVELIGGGSGWHVTAQGRHRARAGDVFVLRPGAWHGYEDCRRLVIADVHITTSALRTEAAFLHEMPTLRELLWLRPAAAGRYGVYATHIAADEVADTIEQVHALHRDIAARPANHPRLLGRLMTILGTLAENIGNDEIDRDLHPAVAVLLEHIDAQPERAWTLSELAKLVSLDPAYLIRLFRQHVGLPPVAYVARIRTERAAGLLASTDEPIARVGALVGWPDPAHFARRFRALAGISPTEYRRQVNRPSLARAAGR